MERGAPSRNLPVASFVLIGSGRPAAARPACCHVPESFVDRLADALASFLLKHPRGELARGDLVFAPVIGVLPLAVLVAAGIAVGWLGVRRLRNTGLADKLVLGGLRTAAFLLVGLLLLRPTLVLSRAIAQRNVLAVVLDDSRSMAVADVNGGTRTAAVQRAFGDSTGLMHDLADRFAVRVFRAGADADPIPGAAALTAGAARTDLATALASTREALADVPLAGIVLVSDGNQNGSGDLDAELQRLAARGVPVHAVAVGSPRFDRDIGVDAIRLPREVLLGGEAPGEAVLRVRGVAGRRAILTVEAGGRLVRVDTVLVPKERELMVVPIRVPAVGPGTVPVRVSVEPIDGEVTTLNNHASAILRVRNGPEKILYVEGEPRTELPFLRRAVSPDSALQLVSLIRTARGKHLRLGVDDSLELRYGFPTRPEELFRYRAVILGSVEASYFSGDQLRMLQDFVGTRGGGLLALGGRNALGEGGYAGTPVDEVLPIELDPGVNGRDDNVATEVVLAPTDAGREHPALALGGAHVTSWDSLPALTTVNAPGRLRPGATVLLEGRNTGGTVPVLSVQRYGRGHSAVFLPQDAWRWQLTNKLPVDDETQPAFWDRLLRWTVDGVPDQVELDAAPGLTAPGEPVELRARVADSAYAPRDDARVTARVIPPDAPSFEVPLLPDLGASGEYVGHFTPTSVGAHRVDVTATLGADTLDTSGLVLTDRDLGDPGPVERDDRVLGRIAERTGGQAWQLDNLDDLPEALLLTDSGVTARASSDLWDAPLFFLLLLLLLGIDWSWRRWRGLA